jgi:hypothetical protein
MAIRSDRRRGASRPDNDFRGHRVG